MQLGDLELKDRSLRCSDCGEDFVFTAGEQFFFQDKQFKNDPKRCKLCKAKRAGLGRAAAPGGVATLPFSRTETRTECSTCGVETTVPFKPTQGRPVLCRSCFQMKRVPSAVAAVAALDSPEAQVAAASVALGLSDAEEEPAAAPLSAAATVEKIAQSSATMLADAEPQALAAEIKN